MSDRAAPKGKKPTKGKDVKKVPGPKLVVSNIKPGVGHNSGEKHPEVIKKIDELMDFQAKKKAIAKAERDVRNSLKSEFGILASSVAREIQLRKLAPDVRVQVESNHEDLKKMLGYQPSLDFVSGHATEASAKAQPSEAKLAHRDTEPKRAAPKQDPEDEVEDDQDAMIAHEDDDIDDEDSGIIEREG